jgi:hypothetical protein
MKKIIIIILLLTAGYKEICYAAPKYTVDASQKDKWTNGLVGYWTFDGSDMDWSQASAEARDQSGQGNHGDVVGATVSRGKVGQALSFDGEDDYVYVSPDTSYKPSSFTIAVWIKTNSGDTYEGIVETVSIVGEWIYDYALYLTNGQIRLALGNGSSQYDVTVSESGDLRDDTWHHVAWTFDRPTNKVYLDGSSIGSPANWDYDIAYGNEGLRIGNIDEAPQYFNGSIDEVRIYNRVLGPTEIQEMYNAGAGRHAKIDTSQKDRLTNGLVLLQTFDGPDMDWSQANAEARDVSGQNNHGDVIGATVTRGKVGQALEFNGTSDYVNVGTTNLPEAGPMTITAWINGNDLEPAAEIIGRWDDSGNKFAFTFGADVNNISCYLRNNDNEIYVAGTNNAIETNYGRWVFAACTIENGAIYAYRYGDEQSERAAGIDDEWSASGTGSATTIGARWTNGSPAYFFNGKIDEVRVYNRALSETEIQELYKMGKRKFKP